MIKPGLLLFLFVMLWACSSEDDNKPEFGKVNTITATINDEDYAVSIDPLALVFIEQDDAFRIVVQSYAIPERNSVSFNIFNEPFELGKKYVATASGDLVYQIMIWPLGEGGFYSPSSTETCELVVSEFEVGEPNSFGEQRITKMKAKVETSLTYFNTEKPDEHLNVHVATILINIEQ